MFVKNKTIGAMVLKDILITTASINHLNNHLSEKNVKLGSINLTDVSFLLAIKESPGITQYDLAKSFNTTTQRVSYSIAKMLDLGYVRGNLKKLNNRKTKKLYLETEGKAIIEGLEDYLLKGIFDSLSEKEISLLILFLKKYENFHLDFLEKLNEKAPLST